MLNIEYLWIIHTKVSAYAWECTYIISKGYLENILYIDYYFRYLQPKILQFFFFFVFGLGEPN